MTANQATKLEPEVSELSPEKLKKAHQMLLLASESFIHHEKGSTQIWAASMDWFLEEWGRDTFISLPGLLLSTNRWEEAKQVFQHFAKHEKNGLIPNRIEQDGNVLYNTADAALWFIQALKKYQQCSQDLAFINEMLPVVRKIIQGYQHGTHFQRYGKTQLITMDPEDGLIFSPAQATWMDADAWGDGNHIVTPRNGKCVEINALWYSALKWYVSIDHPYPEHSGSGPSTIDLVLIKTSFNKKFWNSSESCLFDVIEGDPHQGAIRPNQVFAISHGEDLLSKARQKQVYTTVKKDLLTAGGLRTLSPRDSNYHPHYDTTAPMHEKDLAYHQGTVWPWLIGSYCDALEKTQKDAGKSTAQIKKELIKILSPLLQFCLDSPNHSLPEVFSAEPPYEPGGTRSQAWSVAEVLRIISEFELIEEQ